MIDKPPGEANILYYLLHNKEYRGRVLPYLKDVWFQDVVCQTIYKLIEEFCNSHKAGPTPDAIGSMLAKRLLDGQDSLNKGLYEKSKAFIYEHLLYDKNKHTENTTDYFVQETERWMQDREMLLACRLGAAYLGGDEDLKGKILPAFEQALSISLEPSRGHDLFSDAEIRYDVYNRKVKKISFDLKYLNDITGGGVEAGTLSLVMAGTNVGKSLALCHMAAANVRDGFNVVYITLEMSAERIAQRIEANLLDMPINDIEKLSKEDYLNRITELRKRVAGNLKVQQFETGASDVGLLKHFLDEIKQKEGFETEVIYVDYLNLMQSIRYKGNKHGSYTINKAISEELRGMGFAHDAPVWTATQLNREGWASTNPDLSDVSESFGVPMTADFVIVLQQDETMAKENMFRVKQLKNRYADKDIEPEAWLRVDKSRMKLMDNDVGGVQANSYAAYGQSTLTGQFQGMG